MLSSRAALATWWLCTAWLEALANFEGLEHLPSLLAAEDEWCSAQGRHDQRDCALFALQQHSARSVQTQKDNAEGMAQTNMMGSGTASAGLWSDSTAYEFTRHYAALNDAEWYRRNSATDSFELARQLAKGATFSANAFEAPLDNEGYLSIAALKSDGKMSTFIRRVVEKLGGVVTDVTKLQQFAQLHSGTRSVRTYHHLLKEIRDFAKVGDAWVKLPPPEAGSITSSMIRSDPWVCSLLPPGDPRGITCKDPVDIDGLNPQLLTCGRDGVCNIEHANAFRTTFAIGALPCCRTKPFCAAPACQDTDLPAPKSSVCTKRPAAENVEYMRQPQVWPAYHGWGGAFELDTLKFVDLLGCGEHPTHRCSNSSTPVDLVLDLGANVGYYTEKLTARNFAKNYILIEGNPVTANVIRKRFTDEDWKRRWFSEQVPRRNGVGTPDFEVLSFALSNSSGGTVNMCETEFSFSYAPGGCQRPLSSVDDLLAAELSPTFRKHFDEAREIFIKVDTEGMDELVLRGMRNVLSQLRGEYADGSPRYLVNFMQFEFAPALTLLAKKRGKYTQYDIHSVTWFLEKLGFESFVIGPRFLPLSHGSWHDDYRILTEDPENNAGVRTNYPNFDGRICPWCGDQESASFTADVFVLRSSHPRATELKLALGACKESEDFHLSDPQYAF